jgi:hypothetical protein
MLQLDDRNDNNNHNGNDGLNNNDKQFEDNDTRSIRVGNQFCAKAYFDTWKHII